MTTEVHWTDSLRAQMAATAGALVLVTAKSGLTACARAMKSATASYCESAARSGRRLVVGTESVRTGTETERRMVGHVGK